MYRFATSVLFVFAICLAVPAAYGNNGYRFLRLDGHTVKWGTPKLGAGASLTYAIVTGTAKFSGIYNCRGIKGVGSLLARSGLTQDAFARELAAAFGMWENAANVRFVREKTVAAADILISAETIADGLAYADVTPASSSGPALGRVKRGIVCLNPDQYWAAANEASAGNGRQTQKTYNLRYVLAHEIGHVLGLDHPGPKGELMSFEYNGKLNGLQPGDIAGIVALYGPVQHRAPAPVIALNSPHP